MVPNHLQKLYLKDANERGIELINNKKSVNEKINDEVAEEVIKSKKNLFLITEIFPGRINYRLLIPLVFLGLLFVLFIALGLYIFLLFEIFCVIGIYRSFPQKLYLESDGLYVSNLFTKKRKMVSWEAVKEIRNKEINDWDGLFNIAINILFFRWLSLLLFRWKHYHASIVHSEFQEYRISSYNVKNYPKLLECLNSIITVTQEEKI